MNGDIQDTRARTLSGIAHALIGFSIFSMQDAIVKWLVATLPVWEVLFSRSLIIIILASAIAGRPGWAEVVRGRARGMLLLRGMLILIAWLAYFTAARSMHLAELVTIYFATPIFVMVMSIVILHETVSPIRWIATIIGFGGVVLAANPSSTPDLLPAALTLFAAFCWGLTTILVRRMSGIVSTMSLMLGSNALFLVVCGAVLPFIWVTPDALSLCLLLALGFVGAVGQYFLFEGYQRAPASVVAPFEYVTLILAFFWGFVIWHDWPASIVFAGAGLILVSGAGLFIVEHLAHRRRS